MGLISKVASLLYRLRRRIATGAAVLLVTLLAFHVIFGANGMIVYEQKRNEYKALNSQLDDLQKENEKLNLRIKALKTDPKTIEKEAREQLRYVRPGEVIYSLPAEKQATPLSTAQK